MLRKRLATKKVARTFLSVRGWHGYSKTRNTQEMTLPVFMINRLMIADF